MALERRPGLRWARFSDERRKAVTIGTKPGVASAASARNDATLDCWPAFCGSAA